MDFTVLIFKWLNKHVKNFSALVFNTVNIAITYISSVKALWGPQ